MDDEVTTHFAQLWSPSKRCADKARVRRLLQDLPSTQHPTSPSLTAATTVDSIAVDSNRGRGRGKNMQGQGDGDQQN